MMNANSPFLVAILLKAATNQLIAGLADSSELINNPGPSSQYFDLSNKAWYSLSPGNSLRAPTTVDFYPNRKVCIT